MSEEQILSEIANYCQDDRLIFQVIVEDRQAHIYINRQTETDLDYSQLSDDIVAALSNLDRTDIERLCLYSRVAGETEPDWHTDIALMAIATDSASTEETAIEDLDLDLHLESEKSTVTNSSDNLIDPPSANEPTSQTPIDLNSYCFIRNKRLLSSELVVPKPNVARLIQTLHEFTDSSKVEQLTVLDDYLSGDRQPNFENFTPEIQAWWQEILALSSEECRKAAIWFSRYCFDPQATLATIESVFLTEQEIAESKRQAQAEANKSKSESRSPTEYSHVPQPQRDRPQARYGNTDSNIAAKRSAEANARQPFKINLLVPIIWLIVTLSFVIFDLNQPVDAFPTVCENLTQENTDYCTLAAKIVGEEHLSAVIDTLPEPLTPEEQPPLVAEAMMEKGSMPCELQANIAAGVPLRDATPFKTPVLSASTAEIMPDFYVADVEQANLKEGDPKVRTICFSYRVKKIGKPYSIKFLTYDRVDLGWPTVAYEPTERVKSIHTLNKTVRTYNFLSLFGVNTLFTAIAIYLLAIYGMAIRVDSIATIYQASFILGIAKSILSFLPVLGIFILIPIECLALGITSACVKGFDLDWNAGYYFVAATAMLLIVTRMLFTFLFLGLLSSILG